MESKARTGCLNRNGFFVGKAFHICHKDRMTTLLCPNGTLFNQRFFVCDWWFNVDCSKAAALYVLNDKLGTTVRPAPSVEAVLSYTQTTATPSFARFERNNQHWVREPSATFYSGRHADRPTAAVERRPVRPVEVEPEPTSREPVERERPVRQPVEREASTHEPDDEREPLAFTELAQRQPVDRESQRQARARPWPRYVDAYSYRRDLPEPFSDSPFKDHSAADDEYWRSRANRFVFEPQSGQSKRYCSIENRFELDCQHDLTKLC